VVNTPRKFIRETASPPPKGYAAVVRRRDDGRRGRPVLGAGTAMIVIGFIVDVFGIGFF
jgi:hypothetical protein